MRRVPVVLISLALSACASAPDVVPVANLSAEPESATEIPVVMATEVETVGVSEIDNGRVCESERRPGSRIAQTVCYTREEHAALQARRSEEIAAYIDALDEDQRNRAFAQQEMERQRRSQMSRIGQ